ncbi:MAG: hypothetical protein KDJ35_02480 [Alphaproteobacteria bacterium]|nr:hypothetical protein [Alphaproteobacteria bacterium]
MAVFDPLTVGSLLVLAAGGGGLACDMPKATAINVTPKTLDIRYDYSQSLNQIQKIKSDTIDPHGFGGVSVTQGFMSGGIKLRPQVKLAYMTYERQGAACVWYDTIDVVLEIDPSIVIAKEVYEDRCMHEAVRRHELKHVKVDREIVNKYARIMGKKLYDELSVRGFKSGIINAAGTQTVMERMQDTVYDIVKHEYKKMELERIDLQRAVDNIKEYESVRDQCPSFQEKYQSRSGYAR